MSYWEDCLELGECGEKIVTDWMQKLGIMTYAPEQPGSHPIDRVAYQSGQWFLFDVKTKARLNKWNATGYDAQDHAKYSEMAKQGKKVRIFFVDMELGAVYCCTISDRFNQRYTVNGTDYPFTMSKKKGDVTIFSLEKMTKIFDLTDEQINKLRSLTISDVKFKIIEPTKFRQEK